MTKTQLRDQLAQIVVKASARGNGITVTKPEAFAVVDAIAASDTAPEWDQCRQGRDVLTQVIAIYRTM